MLPAFLNKGIGGASAQPLDFLPRTKNRAFSVRKYKAGGNLLPALLFLISVLELSCVGINVAVLTWG